MNNQEIINELENWANDSHSYLSERTDYARGYKEGISQAKVIVSDILDKQNQSESGTQECPYFIDYIYNNPSGANFYHQLVRRKDNAILYANPKLEYVQIECWKLGINTSDVEIL